jgi:mono/diheme cytochrome c family protein
MRAMPSALVICLSLCYGIAVPAQGPSSDGLASNRLFQKNCTKCHGKTADGRHFAGPSLKTEKVTGTSNGDLRAIIANGKGHMPKFGDKLTPDEIAALADQIKALK